MSDRDVTLPRKLTEKTLGDVLGVAHRAGLTGVLELTNEQGRTAELHLRSGLVVGATGALPDGALPERVDALFAWHGATLRFRAATRRDEERLLGPETFLHGRPRGRDRGLPPREPSIPTEKRRALATLGLSPSATMHEIQSAFRMLAARLHPDRHGHAPPHVREAISAHFSRLSQAYHALVT